MEYTGWCVVCTRMFHGKFYGHYIYVERSRATFHSTHMQTMIHVDEP